LNLSEKLKAFICGKELHKKPPDSSLGGESDDFQTSGRLDNGCGEDLCRLTGGRIVNTPYGQHLLVQNTYEWSFCHGGIKLGEIRNISPDALKLLAKDDGYARLNFDRSVFIDTETTGLAGGSGTYAFLIGVGFFDCTGFKLNQYFMRDYDEEPAVLFSLGNLLKDFEAVVSFNGRAYDIPLLSARFLINRMENHVEKPLHLDLLSSARRLYRERLESVSLSSLETKLFSLHREGDIPSFEIPSIYFRYLREKNPYPLQPIFYHNRMDILSLVTLTVRMAAALENPFCSGDLLGQDYYCLGRLYEDMGMIEESISCYNRALDVPGVKERAYLQLSLLYKRLEKWNDAEKLWIKMARDNIHGVFALVELAKFYEHRLKDYKKAAVAAQRALEIAYKNKGLQGFSAKNEIEELKKRLARIRCKQGNIPEQVKII
jgi:hypothetical protein